MKLALANTLTQAINDAFLAIGSENGTSMPRSKGNLEPLAWEYHVASGLASAAEKRKNAAVKACITAGIMFDHKKQPLCSGVHSVVYEGDIVRIIVDVGTPGERFDANGFRADLEAKGVDPKLLLKLTEKHTHHNAAPHKFQAQLVTS